MNIRRRMLSHGLASVICMFALLSAGCGLVVSPTPASGPATPRIALPDRAVFYTWDAVIAEGAYTSTRLLVCEVDFAAGKIRAVDGRTSSGQTPRLMPSNMDRVMDALAAAQWRGLSEDRMGVLRSATLALLRSDPPAFFYLRPPPTNVSAMVSTEHLRTEELTLYDAQHQRSVKADASGRGSLPPSTEWIVLTTALNQYAAESAVPGR